MDKTEPELLSVSSSWSRLVTALEQDTGAMGSYMAERDYTYAPLEARVTFLENRCSDLLACLTIVVTKLAEKMPAVDNNASKLELVVATLNGLTTNKTDKDDKILLPKGAL